MRLQCASVFLFTCLFASWAQGFSCPQNLESRPSNQKAPNGYSVGVMDLRHAQAYFNAVKNQNFANDYVVDGCDMRAYMASKFLDDKYHIKTFRMILNAENGSRLYTPTPHTLEGGAEFGYHTATAFCVKNPANNQVEPYIIDPAFFDEIVPVSVWRDQFTKSDPAQNQVRSTLSYTTMYTFNPVDYPGRRSFRKSEVREANELLRLFRRAQNRMELENCKPLGVGRYRVPLRNNPNDPYWCKNRGRTSYNESGYKGIF